MSEIKLLEEQALRAERARQEGAAYRAARGDRQKLKSYVTSCSVCEFKQAAQSEIVSIARRDCDRMATSFDSDLPSSIPSLADTAALSDSEVEQALSGCWIVREADSSRRYLTQAGRAFAARAVRRAALPGSEADARSDMAKAVTLWKTALAQKSGAAMNFLGAYFKGSFNTKTVSFMSPDFKSALDYWLKGAEVENAKSMRNAGALLLIGSPDAAPVERDVPRARALLENAVQHGDMTAASELGKAFFYGSPSEIGKNVSRGLELLAKACASGDAGAKQFFDKEMKRDKYRALLPSARPSGCDSDDDHPEAVPTEKPSPSPIATATYWEFSGSIFSLSANGSSRKFYYHTPREGLAEVSVTRGTLFFEGLRRGSQYSGKAYVFSRYCGAMAYAVTGAVSADDRRVELSGKAPRRNQKCEIINQVDMPIVFTLRAAGVN